MYDTREAFAAAGLIMRMFNKSLELKEVHGMKKRSRLCFRAFLVFLVMLCCAFAEAQAQPERTITVQGEADPYTVTLYSTENYKNPIGTWKLAPGMRMLKIPQLDKIPRSILLGANVSAIIFPNSHFASNLFGSTAKDVVTGATTVTYLIPYWRLKGSASYIYGKYEPRIPCSLIIHRKDIDDVLGVYLQSGTNFLVYGQFFPLPDSAKEMAVIYNKILFEPSKASFAPPLSLRLESGGLGQWSLYSLPNPNNIAVTITTPEGATVKLPEPNSYIMEFDLAKYGVQKISSLMIQYKGPFKEQDYLPVQAVRAPSAPDVVRAPAAPDLLKSSIPVIPGSQSAGIGGTEPVAQASTSGQLKVMKVPDVSGQWGSSIGLVYEIAQTDDRFEWTVKSSNELGKGTLKGTELSVSWSGQQGSGSAQGKITKMDGSGRAMQINWDNGVRFNR